MSGTSWSRPAVRRPGQLQRLVGDERFGGAIVNTLYYTAASVPLTMGIGLLIALLLNNQIRARGFFRTLFYLPVVTPLVIAAIIWKWVYNGDFGLLNYYLIQLDHRRAAAVARRSQPGHAGRDHHQRLEERRLFDGRLSGRVAVDPGGLLRRGQGRRRGCGSA